MISQLLELTYKITNINWSTENFPKVVNLKCVGRDDVFEKVAESGVDMIDGIKKDWGIIHFTWKQDRMKKGSWNGFSNCVYKSLYRYIGNDSTPDYSTPD